MSGFWSRRGAVERNQLSQSCSELLGIAEGLLADGTLHDSEIHFLSRWLETHAIISCEWPGDVLHARVKNILADGIITPDERSFLANTLSQIVGGQIDAMSEQCKVNALAFDEPKAITIPSSFFCFTGEFVFAPRPQCEKVVAARGGIILKSVTQKLHFLVVGGLGSDEWKHGSFGTKIAKAVEYQRRGCPLQIIREDCWSAALAAPSVSPP